MRGAALGSVLVAAAIVLGGCAGADPDPGPVPSPSVTTPAPQSVTVDVYFSHAQPTRFTLIAEPHAVTIEAGPTGDGSGLEPVLASLVSGELQPFDPDYANLWGEGSALRSMTRAGGILTLDLAIGDLSLGAEAEGIAISQLVWTALGIDPSLTAVQLTVDGATSETLAGHVDISDPISQDAPESVLSPLQITSLQEGDVLTSPVVVAGVACVFEAAFTWTLEGPGGAVEEGAGMAAGSCPARAAWHLDLGALDPGTYTLTVIETSMADGSVASTDSKTFTVSG